MMKHTLTLLTGLLLAQLTVLHAAETPEPGAKPNIVFILVDDLGYADIGPFGSTKNRTPQLDRMGREGMKLSSFLCCACVRALAGAGDDRLLRAACIPARRLSR